MEKKVEKKKVEEKKEVELPKEVEVDLVKAWESNLPQLKFDFYDFKTVYVNSQDKL